MAAQLQLLQTEGCPWVCIVVVLVKRESGKLSAFWDTIQVQLRWESFLLYCKALPQTTRHLQVFRLSSLFILHWSYTRRYISLLLSSTALFILQRSYSRCYICLLLLPPSVDRLSVTIHHHYFLSLQRFLRLLNEEVEHAVGETKSLSLNSTLSLRKGTWSHEGLHLLLMF